MIEANSPLYNDAMKTLAATSRTFFIPIDRLPNGLKEAVASAYLCMRAIDEIEDDPSLPASHKTSLLEKISSILVRPFMASDWNYLFRDYHSLLPEVTLRINDWAKLSPSPIAQNIFHATAVMAKGMAVWVQRNWTIRTKDDLDNYTYYVAGLVGELLNEIWHWYDQTDADQELAIAFGRGLQAVNIIRNRDEDLKRGVDFFPDGWEKADMFSYARQNLEMADRYMTQISNKAIYDFCKIPVALAHGTLDIMEAGKRKLTRNAVKAIVKAVTGK
ncbi:farnesyl-diphosphate farnesyltransferase [Seinonella peptonophila]|uniref:Farnesyl-diphosphate farnesyltransferase n=1 Tax=Seinonella peptonophila TaxID=112248 RepID=A0A1M4XK77_9BACL|nr:phytoene/squalene synthase family protein [Seinonella peptonophila]SHE93622.1 farnesyl-diphosphate farnesyltransferase [Seinonella peptonophila]